LKDIVLFAFMARVFNVLFGSEIVINKFKFVDSCPLRGTGGSI